MAEELREDDFLYDLWNKGEVGHRAKILQIIVVKAGLLKEGFYNGGFVNLRKCTRDEGFVLNCVGKIVLRHSSRREEGMGSSSQVLGADFCNWVSSAEEWWRTEWLSMTLERGAVYRTKRTGARTDPSGTPQLMISGAELQLFTVTVWVLFVR